MGRRAFLASSGAAIAAGLSMRQGWIPPFDPDSTGVFIARVNSYDRNLVEPILCALHELGFDRKRIRGLSVVLKPNLVEPRTGAPHVNTHPAVILAAAEAFRRLDARAVLIAEGPGHERDIELVLDRSGFGRALAENGLTFVDLNEDRIRSISNRLHASRLSTLELPATILDADLVVSVAKLKTHHWAGLTLSMKNLFGVMPGARYGWPKNLLHHAGITESILDINAAVRPGLAIIDGIVGMEGDGPIMGPARQTGVLILGANPTSVDATAARIVGCDPASIDHLARAGSLGPIAQNRIPMRGEVLELLATPFAPPPRANWVRSDEGKSGGDASTCPGGGRSVG